MLTLTHKVRDEQVRINVPETREDLQSLAEALSALSRTYLALDTETTGTGAYTRSFRVRTVQVGTGTDAWVVPIDERDPGFVAEARRILTTFLTQHRYLVMHNAPYDIIALERAGLLCNGTSDLQQRTIDTQLMAQLLDPRAAGDDNAVGSSLKGQAAARIDLWAADTQDGLTEVFRKDFKLTKDKGWAAEGLTNHETYLRYAGLDVIYTSRLLAEYGRLIKARGLSKLMDWERRIQAVTLNMQVRGVLVDVDYTQGLVQQLHDDADQYRAVALTYGVENINSTKQVADALVASGVKLTAKTPSGALAVGKDVLLPLAGLTPYWVPIDGATPHPLAEAVVKAKRAEKWRVAYAEAFLERDSNDRVHPGIRSLAARTGRMSLVDPPLQQLPSGDWRIRRCLIPDPGNVFISTDFSQIELRVMAANAGVAEMIDAIKTGEDLHNRTATLIWPEGWGEKQRKIAKNVAFGYVYGAGPKKIAETAGITYPEARKVVQAFERGYPEIPNYANRLQEEAERNNWLIVTDYGRELPVAPSKAYAAVNYAVQGAARDLFAEALLKVDDLGLRDRVALPIHDEILHQAPIAEAEEQAQVVRTAMQRDWHGVPIDADSEILWGESWGSGYGIPPEHDRNPAGRQRMIDGE